MGLRRHPGESASLLGGRCPHWPPAGLLNTARRWDAQSPPNDSEDTPDIHSHARLHSLPLTVTQSRTRERALLKHTPPKTLKQRQGTCTYLHTPRLLQTHGSPHSPARQTQTGQHTHIPSLTLTLRHAHRGLSLRFHIVYHRENKCFRSLAQRKGKEKMEVNVSASKREGKDTKQGRQPEHPPPPPPLPRA